jgi:predicted nucleotidyltransferase
MADLGEEGLTPAPDVDDETFLGVLSDALAALEREAIPHLLIGGLASAALGRPRWTHDVDVLVTPPDARRALDALSAAGFQTEETNPHWIFKALRRGVVIDLLFRVTDGIYLDDEMVARGIGAEIGGRSVTVAAPEDQIVIKAIAHDEASARHWYDALSLITTSELDWNYLVRRAQHGARRVLSLLIYAQSSDLVVPDSVIRELFEIVYADGAPDPP